MESLHASPEGNPFFRVVRFIGKMVVNALTPGSNHER